MAKTLSEKSIIIRRALAAHPAKGNTELAAMLNDAVERLDDRFKFTGQEVANQKQMMKKPGVTKVDEPLSPSPVVKLAETVAEIVADEPAPAPATPEPKRRGRKPGAKNKPRATAPAAARTTPRPAPATVSAADLVGRVFALAKDCGGMGELRRLVEALAGA